MVNYNNAKIYKIVDNTNNNIYIGSTCEPTLARRLALHVRNYKYYLKNNIRYISSVEILKNDDYDIILIENINCINKDELHKRERFFIENNECVNMRRPFITKNDKKKSDKLYRDKNKDKINEIHNCLICDGKYSYRSFTRHNKSNKHMNQLNNNFCIFKLFE